MKSKLVLAAISVLLALSGCKAMETADKKMQTVDKKVSEADANFRKKVGLKPYQKDATPASTDSN